MTKAIYEQVINGNLYEVFYDEDYVADRDELGYLDKGLECYGVVMSHRCNGCLQWYEQDSIWGMILPSPEEAIKDYIENFESK